MPTPEEQARTTIDHKLEAAGWLVQDFKAANLTAGPGVAVREFPTASGPADYVLFVDRQAVGVIEAKAQGTTLRGVSEQSTRYRTDFPHFAQSFGALARVLLALLTNAGLSSRRCASVRV